MSFGAWFASLLVATASSADPVMDPTPVRLGETGRATLRFERPECAQAGSRADVSVNVGEFGPIREAKPGSYEADYTPPPTRFPQMALVAVWCENAPEQMTLVRLPLHGRTTLPVTTEPGSTVEVEVGDETFGPVTADARGYASLPIWVPPGVKEAFVVGRDKRGVRTQARVQVDVPAYNRLTVVVTPRTLPADAKTPAHVVAHYDGAPEGFSPEILQASANVGALSFERADANAVVYRYVPPADAELGPAKLKLEIAGDAASQTHTVIALREPEIPPGRLSLGARVGFAYGLGQTVTPRTGVHAWMPFQLFRRNFALGADLTLGGVGQDVVNPVAGAGQASVSLVPLAVRVGYELNRGRRHWVHAGLGAQVVYARYSTTFASGSEHDTALNGFGAGPLAFGSAALAVGPGEVFAELSFAFSPVSARAFRVQAGGLAFGAGYRIALWR